MRGTILIYKPHDPRPVVIEIEGEPTLPALKDAIGGGYLEVVPRFTHIHHDGKVHRCVAFCDEDGKRKQLPYNAHATQLWDAVMRASVGCGCAPDYLVGQIGVVFGDPAFMKAL